MTDIGGDIDDLWALALLLSMPAVRLDLVLTDSFSAARRADILADFLTRVGRSDVPIGVGVNRTGDDIAMCGYVPDGALSRYTVNMLTPAHKYNFVKVVY